MDELILALDLLTILGTLTSAWLWFAASRRSVRRVSRSEVLDAADINRLVIALNRGQILNRRAALATAATAILGGARMAVGLLADGQVLG